MRLPILRKYKHLSSVVLMCFLIFAIIALLLGYFVFSHTYEKLREQAEQEYSRSAASLSMEFTELMEVFRLHAASVVYRNQTAEKRISLARMQEHPYYFAEAYAILRGYQDPIIDASLYLSYQEADIILTTDAKFSLRDFAAYADIDLSHNRSLLTSFLTDGSGLRFFSTFSTDAADAKLFCGYPVSLNKDKCLIFYGLDDTAFADSSFAARYGEEMEYYLVRDDGTLLLANRDRFLALSSEALSAFLASDAVSMTVGDDTIYKSYHDTYGMYFLVKLPNSLIFGGLESFSDTIRGGFLLIILVLLVLLCFAAYLSYRPIYTLVKHIPTASASRSSGEIATILDAFGEIEGTVAEQRESLLEYLLLNLLTGVPIPPESPVQYPEFFGADAYLVCVAVGLRIDSAKRSALQRAVRETNDASVYIVDILQKNETVLVVLPQSNDGAVADDLRAYICSTFGESYKVGASTVVKSHTELFDAYLDALVSLESVGHLGEAEEHELVSSDEFISEKTAYFLDYVKAGDAENALQMLSVIGAYVEEKVHTAMYQRYIVYSFLTKYVKLVKSLGLPTELVNTTQLLSYTDVRALFETMQVSVRSVCAHVGSLSLDVYDTLRRDVLEYVNEHFTDADLCRNQIADHFGISVYSLSRIFKDTIDVGFKEYVNAKRLTLSKSLLLMTNDSISRIAAKVGFTNGDYFTRIFRSTFDMTPTKYRELHKDR